MDPAYLSAFAALAGSTIGGLTSLATSWLTQHVQFTAQQLAHDITMPEEWYKDFIEEASKLYADAYEHDQAETSKLVNLYAMVSRMRVLSSRRIEDGRQSCASDHRDVSRAEQDVSRYTGDLG